MLCSSCSVKSHSFFCEDCQSKIKVLENLGCRRCAEDHGPYLRPETCPSCNHSGWFLKKVLALASYESPISDAILQLKFGGQGRGARALALKLKPLVNKEDFDWLMPVPNPFLRQLKRGYNQAELLAREVADLTALPFKSALSCRFESSQLGLKAEKRRKKSAEHFKLKVQVKEARILLVDDVLTTGGTANACAKTLLDAGAKEVTALVLGRSLKKRA